MYSFSFAQYYDKFIGGDTTIPDLTQKLVATYAPKKKSLQLLELGCGTGNILQKMPKAYTLYGLDISKDMLAIARQKLPQATFVEGNMTDFKIDQTFDVIICVYDSINHLSTWRDWKRVMKLAYKYLAPGGIFILDMNTVRRLDSLALMKPYVGKLDDTTLLTVKVFKEKKSAYLCQFTLIENILSSQPVLIDQPITETAFTSTKVENEIKKYFSIKKKIDPFRKKVTSESGRIFFVCKKLSHNKK